MPPQPITPILIVSTVSSQYAGCPSRVSGKSVYQSPSRLQAQLDGSLGHVRLAGGKPEALSAQVRLTGDGCEWVLLLLRSDLFRQQIGSAIAASERAATMEARNIFRKSTLE